jgi:two-component system invasion response regulator UvrY
MIHVLIVDDHDLVRAGLRRILEDSPAIKTISEASSGEEALRRCRSDPPDVVLLDLTLPRLSAFELTGRLQRTHASSRVIVLASHAKSPYPTRLLGAGAVGYLTKDCEPEELIRAVTTVSNGRRYIGSEAAKQLALSILPGTSGSPFDGLSARELEVMQKLTEGKRVPDIANILCLSPKTVATYKYRIYEKLGTRSEVDLLRMVMRYGLMKVSQA